MRAGINIQVQDAHVVYVNTGHADVQVQGSWSARHGLHE
jgi:hypothetical protein